MLADKFTILSNHDSQSFLFSLDRRDICAADWVDINKTISFYDSFKNNEGIVTSMANTNDNSLGVVYVRGENQIYVIRRDKTTSEGFVLEDVKLLSMSSLPENFVDLEVRSMRLDKVQRDESFLEELQAIVMSKGNQTNNLQSLEELLLEL